MTKSIKRLKELHFTGGRFDDNKGWLDFDVLPELQNYKKLLIETAKDEWRRQYPTRERLPKGFDEHIHLGFREIRNGSCTIPIERIVDVDDGEMDLNIPDILDDAAQIIDETLIAIRDNSPFPDKLSKRIIPMFDDWGKTLKDNESIILIGQSGDGPRFDSDIRKKLHKVKTEHYLDKVDIVGEVRAASLKVRDGGSFTILLDNRESVQGVFTDEQETKITEALYQHKQIRLRIVGLGEFEPSGMLSRLVRIDLFEMQPVGEIPFDPDAPPIWEVIAKIGESIPEEEWKKVPTDLSYNLDHYLYGSPKKDV